MLCNKNIIPSLHYPTSMKSVPKAKLPLTYNLLKKSELEKVLVHITIIRIWAFQRESLTSWKQKIKKWNAINAPSILYPEYSQRTSISSGFLPLLTLLSENVHIVDYFSWGFVCFFLSFFLSLGQIEDYIHKIFISQTVLK